MEFIDLVHARYSVRGYRSDPVPETVLAGVLEAGRLAPSAKNAQPWCLIVVRDGERRRALHERVYPRPWFTQAPIVLAVCCEPGVAFVRDDGLNYAVVDATILMDHLVLAATAAGLGTCWIGKFDAPAAREVLALPPHIEPVALTPPRLPECRATPARPETATAATGGNRKRAVVRQKGPDVSQSTFRQTL
jgi:nitroreductase